VDTTVELPKSVHDRTHHRPHPERERSTVRRLAPVSRADSTGHGRDRAHDAPAARDRSPLTLDSVDELAKWARAERARAWFFSPDRAYYLGMETAAEQVLHPQREALRTIGWYDRSNPAFMAGYMETTALLAPLWSWSSSRPVDASSL
jgi:hypothetical protein